ncbi:MAG: multicopper oxidase family protein [Cyanobacteriota bacterium]
MANPAPEVPASDLAASELLASDVAATGVGASASDPPGWSRRQALQWGLLSAGGLLLPRAARAAEASGAGCRPHAHTTPAGPPVPTRTSPQIPRFEQPFRRLEALAPERVGSDLDGYTLTIARSPVEILPGRTTQAWTYNGSLPGPLIRQRKGRASVVRFINQLQDPSAGQIATSIHLHGMASLPQYDGYAEDLIPFNHYKDYYYPNNKGGPFWYHDHAIGQTSRNVYMGLAGLYIVDYDAEDFADPTAAELLPQGEFDIPMVIQDKRLDGDGSLVFNDRQQRGLYGDVLLINGVPWPRLVVKDRPYRFRILNGGTSRVLQLGLQAIVDGRPQPLPLLVVASDSGLLPQAVPCRSLRMGVAERYEVIVDFRSLAGKAVFLSNPIQAVNLDGDLRSTSLLCFQVEKGPAERIPLPDRLGVLTPIATLLAEARASGAPVRTFRFDRLGSQWVINNKVWDPNRVDAQLKPCATEIWRFENPGGGWVHPVHVHLGHFRLLSRDGSPPPVWEAGMKDTFYVGDFQKLEIIGRFGPHEGKYMIHCHNLVHEDHDMMTQFQIGTNGCDPCAAPARPLPAPAAFDAPRCLPGPECSLPPEGRAV